MESKVFVSKFIRLETRDFRARSYADDGTAFHVSCKNEYDDALRSWFGQHRFDNFRKGFTPHDENDRLLRCRDEIEAQALVVTLQREYNEVAR